MKSYNTGSSYSSSFGYGNHFSPYSSSFSIKQGPGGLDNIGNTCFLNSSLQALFHLPQINNQLKKLDGNITNQYINLWQDTKKKRGYGSKTYDLKRAVSYKSHMFRGYAQEDAHEFFITLLNLMHQELNNVKTRPKYQQLKDQKSISLEQSSNIWWKYMRARDDSRIYDYFLGQILSRVFCKQCKHKSVAFDQFLTLPLSFPKSNYSSSFSWNTPSQQLEKLILNFQQQEQLSSYQCQRCKKRTRCTRKLDLWRLPQILAIHLKRFQYGSYRRRKLDDTITIPPKINFNKLTNKQKEFKNADYILNGVVKHSGSIDGGHYTATQSGQWYNFNDSSVRKTDIPKQGSSPYMLIYVRSNLID